MDKLQRKNDPIAYLVPNSKQQLGTKWLERIEMKRKGEQPNAARSI